MGPGITWNLFEWVRRVGAKRDDAPPIMGTVQPTVLLGDHSALTSPLLPPVAWYGGIHTTGGSATSVIHFECKAPGGAFVLEFRSAFLLGGALSDHFGLRAIPGTVTSQTSVTATNMNPAHPVQSFCFQGEGSPITPALRPGTQVTAGQTYVTSDFLYVPPGFHAYWQTSTAPTALQRVFGLLVQEVPVPIPDP